MRILRRGARADHGTRSVDLKLASLKWNPSAEAFDITFVGAVRDFSTNGRHQYWLRVSPQELALILQMLPEAGAAMEGDDFTDVFRTACPSLFKLQAMASGIKVAA